MILDYVYFPISTEQAKVQTLKTLPWLPKANLQTHRGEAMVTWRDTDEGEIYNDILNDKKRTYLLFACMSTYSRRHYVFSMQEQKYVSIHLIFSVGPAQASQADLHIHTDLDVLLKYVGLQDLFYIRANQTVKNIL